jgi:hypothetical protein
MTRTAPVNGPAPEKALASELYASQDGLRDWENQRSRIPAGKESSPGVRFNDALWLVGGSAVDPAKKSNEIYRLDLNNPGDDWQRVEFQGPAFEERMGHACIVVNGKIWVLGGLGASEVLRDVWELDYVKGKIKATLLPLLSREGEGVLWSPRCQFSAALFWNEDLWLAGGATSPNGAALTDGIWRCFGPHHEWKRVDDNNTKIINGARGVAFIRLGNDKGLVVFVTRDVAKIHAMTLDSWDSDTNKPRWTEVTAPSIPSSRWRSSPHSIFGVFYRGRVYLRFLHRDALYVADVAKYGKNFEDYYKDVAELPLYINGGRL